MLKVTQSIGKELDLILCLSDPEAYIRTTCHEHGGLTADEVSDSWYIWETDPGGTDLVQSSSICMAELGAEPSPLPTIIQGWD